MRIFTNNIIIPVCYITRIKLLTNICKHVGITNVEFISESLAESKYLIPKEEKDLRRIVIDVGYLTKNVFIAFGNGILYQKAFSYGGGYITADLLKIIEIILILHQ